MPLFNIDRERVTTIPHSGDYARWKDRLERSGHFDAIWDKLNSMVDENDIHTSSWMPGDDWTGTPFQPIYDIAANGVYQNAAFCFGLILWEVMMHRPEEEIWFFTKSENIRGTVYFRPRP